MYAMTVTLRATQLLAAGLLSAATVSGCGGAGPAPIAPVGMIPTDRATIANWRRPYVPAQARRYNIRPWQFRNERGSAAGRATVVILPPDSLRFDYRGPFRQTGKAALVGDSALWVEPEDELGNLVGVAPLFWASLGVPPAPPEGATILAVQRPALRAWQYAHQGDTITFVIHEHPVLRILGEVRRDGRTVTRAEATLDSLTRYVRQATIEYPLDVSRFAFDVESVEEGVEVDRARFLSREQ
jgi:hypothetical protein